MLLSPDAQQAVSSHHIHGQAAIDATQKWFGASVPAVASASITRVMLADAIAGAPAEQVLGSHQRVLPVNMVGAGQLMCVQETTAFMDTTAVAVTARPAAAAPPSVQGVCIA